MNTVVAAPPQGEDLSTVAWVAGELQRSLDAAHKSLHRFLRETQAAADSDIDTPDTTILRSARVQLHQSVGALELVDLPIPARVLRASEAAVQRLIARPALADRAAVEAIEHASFAVLDYVHRTLARRPISSVALFPQYRAVAQLGGGDRIHPADLWGHQWRWQDLPTEVGVAPRVANDAARDALESHVLALMRRADATNTRRMSDFCAELGAGARSTLAATVWRLAAAFFDAQSNGLLDSDVYAKRMASRLLAQLRANVRSDDEVSERLAADLLFFCARAKSPPAGVARRLTAVREAWQLGETAGVTDYETARLGRFDPAAVAAARKRVAAAKEAWSAVAGGETRRAQGVTEAFALMGDSLRLLLPSGEHLAQSLQAAAQRSTTEAPSTALAMEMATTMLWLDAVIEEGELDAPQLGQRTEQIAGRIDAARDGGDVQPLEPWIEELYRRVSDHQTMGSVVSELRGALTEIEKQIDQYFRDPVQRDVLVPVPAQLSAMRGVLSVLDLDQASIAVVHMRNLVDELASTEVDPVRAAETGTFDRLADNLGALGFLIDMLSVQPQLARSLFHFDADQGRLVSAVTTAAAVAPTAETPTAPDLQEKAQTLASQVDDLSHEELTAQLEALTHRALAEDRAGLARAAQDAQIALDRAADEAERAVVRADLARTVTEFVEPAPAPELPPSAPVPPPTTAPIAPGDTGLEDDAEMREIFVEEAREVIAAARASLQALAANAEDVGEITVVRRSFHTLKGSSRMVGLRDFGEAAWACEQVYNARLADNPRLDPALSEYTRDALDHLAGWVDAIDAGEDRGFRSAGLVRRGMALRGVEEPVPAMPAPAPLAAPPVSAAEPALAPLVLDFPAVEQVAEVVAAPHVAEPLEPAGLLPSLDFSIDLAPEPAAEPAAAEETGLAVPLPEVAEWAAPDAVPEPGAMPIEPVLPVAEVIAADLQVPEALALPEVAELPEMVELPDLAELPEVAELADLAEPPPGLGPIAVEDASLAASVPLELTDAVPGLPSAADLDLSTPADGDVPQPPATDQPIVVAADDAPVFELDLGTLDDEGSALPVPEALAQEPAVAVEEPPVVPHLALPDAVDDLVVAADEVAAPPLAEPEPPAAAQPLSRVEDEDVKVVGPLRIAIPLFNIYLNEADEQSRRLVTELAEWGFEHRQRPVPESAMALAHSLAGNSATVGHAELSALARALEHALTRSGAHGVGRDGESELFNDAADEIRRLLHQFAAGFLKGPPAELMLRLADHEHWLSTPEPEIVEPDDPLAPPTEVVVPPEVVAEAEAEPWPAAATDVAEAVLPTEDLTVEVPHVEALAADPWPVEPQPDTPSQAHQPEPAAPEAVLSDILPSMVEETVDISVPETLDVPTAEVEVVPADMEAAPAAAFMTDVGEAQPVELPQSEVVPEPEPDLVETTVSAFSPLETTPLLPAETIVGDDDEADDEHIDAVDALDPDLMPIFEEEAADLLPQLEERMGEWRRHPESRSAPEACLRTLHTFKGGARLAGAMRVGELAHRLESDIEALVASGAADGAAIERLQHRLDRIVSGFEANRRSLHAPAPVAAPVALAEPPAPQPALLPPLEPAKPAAAEIDGAPLAGLDGPDVAPEPAAIANIEPPEPPEPPEPQEPQELQPAVQAAVPATAAAATPAMRVDWSRFGTPDVRSAASVAAAPASASGVVRVRTGLLDRLVNSAGEVSIARARIESDVTQLQGSLEELTGSLERMRRELRDIEVQAESQIASRIEAAKASSQAFDPLEMDRFTRLQELTRMMAESVNDVATVQRSLQRTLQSTEDQLAAQSRLTRELQDDLLRTRMVEFESLADRLYRVVRQSAKDLGKQVRLDITGGSIEVDRGVLERMVGPFEHLLRNSVVHGIESPAQRAAVGKEPVGAVSVHVTQTGNEVSVEFSDDGAGLDLPRIRARAIERGLLAPDAPATDSELAQMIFVSGFSTATQVTELAGRGVGMDVVRSEVNAMGGRIETRQLAGRGVAFRLVLPLTTAVTQVVMLKAGAVQIAMPSTLVEVVKRVPTGDIQAALAAGKLPMGDEDVPLYWLPELLEGPPPTLGGRTQAVVVARSAAQRAALLVDDVLGNQEVVVKNIGPQLSHMPGLAGVTLLPSGAVALIYNPVALAALYGDTARASRSVAQVRPSGASAAEPVQSVPVAEGEPPKASLVMVVDDSLTVRRVTQRLLEREGYRVVLAKDGQDALEKLSLERPAVMLCDIEMPRMDGFELVRVLRADPARADIPVVMITSRIAQKHRDHAAQLGVEHYLGKPYPEDKLLALVAQFAAAAAVA